MCLAVPYWDMVSGVLSAVNTYNRVLYEKKRKCFAKIIIL